MNTSMRVLLLTLLTVFTGCKTNFPPLPATPWNGLEEARQILVERQAAVDTVQAQLKISFTTPSPQKETQNFDAALVMQGDDRFRLRAWKLNQTIFDLTVTPEGTYVVAVDEMKQQSPESEAELAELANHLSALLRGADFEQARLSLIKPDGFEAPRIFNYLWATWPDESLRVAVERRTLSPREWWVGGHEDESKIQIQSEYADYSGLRWYRYIKVNGDFGRLWMNFSDVELNGELNPRAFKPPRRAVRIDESESAGNGSP